MRNLLFPIFTLAVLGQPTAIVAEDWRMSGPPDCSVVSPGQLRLARTLPQPAGFELSLLSVPLSAVHSMPLPPTGTSAEAQVYVLLEVDGEPVAAQLAKVYSSGIAPGWVSIFIDSFDEILYEALRDGRVLGLKASFELPQSITSVGSFPGEEVVFSLAGSSAAIGWLNACVE